MVNGANPIYLDHHATTPVDPRVAQVVFEVMTEAFGNPNSVQHVFGRRAAKQIHTAGDEVARLVGAQADDVRFTTSASEALRLALAFAEVRRGENPLRVVASRIEHPALLDELERGQRAGRYRLRWLDVDAKGRALIEQLPRLLEVKTDLVCLMAANNEVGTLQPIATAAAAARHAGAEILVDATQAAGQSRLHSREDQIDYLVASSHKLYGPKGVGALIGPDLGTKPSPRGFDHHSATANVSGIAGFGAAARIIREEGDEDNARVGRLRNALETSLLAGLPGAIVNGDPQRRLASNLHLSVPDAPNDVVVSHLANTVAISTGAACVYGVDAPSHVLQAMKLESWRQEGALRISLGRFTTEQEIERAAVAIIEAVQSVQQVFA